MCVCAGVGECVRVLVGTCACVRGEKKDTKKGSATGHSAHTMKGSRMFCSGTMSAKFEESDSLTPAMFVRARSFKGTGRGAGKCGPFSFPTQRLLGQEVKFLSLGVMRNPISMHMRDSSSKRPQVVRFCVQMRELYAG